MERALNFWINWAIQAIMGNLQQADALMSRYGAEIQEAAAYLRERNAHVPVRTLYRGMLIPKSQIRGGKLPRLEGYMSTSFTERLEVACWFASPDAGISMAVMMQKPSSKGFIAEYDPVPEEVLFHHAWNVTGLLVKFAEVHPNVPDIEQFAWYLETQQEVITLPPEALYVRPMEEYGCPPADELDDLFHPPSVQRDF